MGQVAQIGDLRDVKEKNLLRRRPVDGKNACILHIQDLKLYTVFHRLQMESKIV